MTDQSYRSKYITSIDAATIAGCNPYMTLAQMFYYKANGYPDLKGNPHVDRGIRMEPIILRKCLPNATPNKTTFFSTSGILAATPDAFLENDVIEVKCPYSIDKFKANCEHYLWQCVHHSIVINKRCILFAANEALDSFAVRYPTTYEMARLEYLRRAELVHECIMKKTFPFGVPWPKIDGLVEDFKYTLTDPLAFPVFVESRL